MATIPTYSGKAFDLVNPSVMDIDIGDIAHHLGNVCRWAGATRRFYSVAEHSWIQAQYHLKQGGPNARDKAILALIHDAPEAYLGEVTRPLKRQLGAAYTTLEERLWALILEKYCLKGISHLMPEVYEVDDRICLDERRNAIPRSGDDAFLKLTTKEPLGVVLYYWPPEIATSKFLEMWHQLGRMN